MANEDIKFQLGATDTGAQAALTKLSTAVTGATDEIQRKFDGLTGVMNKVQGAFVAFTAVLAGGKLFKDAITSTVEMEKAAAGLGKQLGISTTDASVLAIALDDVHVSEDAFTNAASKVAVALKKNEDAFHALGVATRDQNGNFRNQLDIQRDVNVALLKFKEGTDRNVEGIKIYGKAWGEVAPTLKLTQKAIDDARAKAESLGLVIGQENVEAVNRYRDAMNDVGDVTSGYRRAVADQLLPVLSELGEWFAERGPEDIGYFREAMLKITIAIREIAAACRILFDALAGAGKQFVIFGTTISKYYGEMMSGNFTKAGDVLADGWRKYMDAGQKAIAAVKHDWDALQMGIADSFEVAYGKQTPAAPPKPGKHSEGGDDLEKSRLPALNERLEARKVAYEEEQSLAGHFREFSKAQELAYWQEVIGTVRRGSTDETAIKRSISKVKLDIAHEDYQNELASLKAQEDLYSNNLDARLATARAYAAKVAETEGAGSKAALAAASHVLAVQRDLTAQRLQLDEIAQAASDRMVLAGIDAHEREADLELDLGQITNQQRLDQQREFEAQRFELERSALEARIAANQTDIIEVASLNARKLELETQYQARLKAIDMRAALDSGAKWRDTFQNMKSGFESTIAGFLKGTMTIKGLFQGLFAAVADSLAQMVAKNIANIAVQTLLTRGAALKELNASAVAGAGAAYKATVGIPFIGPVLAPAAAAVAYGGIMAFGSQLSAEGGYDVPRGLNPVTQLHQREMVLPAKYADTIRNMEAAGGAISGGSSRPINIHIQALDAKSVKELFKRRDSGLMQAIKHHLRADGRLVPVY